LGIKTLKTVYALHCIDEFEDGYKDTTLMGIFSSKKKALKYLGEYKKYSKDTTTIDGFLMTEYTIDEAD
jgi:hypothetical protein